MKRPFFIIGITYLITAVSIAFNFYISSIVLLAFLLFLVIVAILRKDMKNLKTVSVIFISSLVAATSFYIYQDIHLNKAIDYSNSDHDISGQLCENVDYSGEKYFYTLKIGNVDGNKVGDFKVRLSTSEPLDISLFDIVECKTHFYDIPKDRSVFTTAGYYASKGIVLSGFIYEYKDLNISQNDNKPLEYYPIAFRNSLIKILSDNLPLRYASVLSAVLFGDKNSLQRDIIENFQAIGVSHIISVSGLHVTILSQFIFMLLGVFKVKKRTRALFAIGIILCFMVIVGFKGSIVRAGIMTIIYFLGIVINRDSDALNSLGLAILIILVINPLSGEDIGFLLSSLSTLGIIVFCSKISNYLENKTKNICLPKNIKSFVITGISTTVSATLFTVFPLIVAFKEFSLISIPANLLIVFPMTIMVGCTVLFILLYYIPILSFVSKFTIFFSGIICKYIVDCSAFLASIPFAKINTSMNYIIIGLLFIIMIVAIVITYKRPTKYIKTISILSVIILISGFLGYNVSEGMKTSLTVIDTQDGCGILLSNAGKGAVLLSGGSKSSYSKMNKAISKYCYKGLDYMIIPQDNKAVSSYSADTINTCSPNILSVNQSTKFQDKLSRAVKNNQNLINYKDIANLNLWGNVEIISESNNNKTFMSVKINNIKILLCPMGGKIPDDMKLYYDFAVIGKLPDDIKNLNCSCIILSMSEQDAISEMAKLSTVCNNFLVTGISGNLKIDCNKSGDVGLKSEDF